MIELRNVRKEYKEATPLKDISSVINNGDVISVIGPSGTGKSTLLRCINLLDPPTGGQILFNGEEITAKGYDASRARQKIGMVFQSFNLFDHLTVIENIMLGQVDILKRTRQEAYDKGMDLLGQVGLTERALSYPGTLSGGQKQRAAIARALAMDPEIILFDEPTSALDPSMVGEVESVIRSLSGNGTTMMIVTHDMAFARSICNRVFYLDEGIIYEEGTPDKIFDDPEKDRTRRFIRQLKDLEFLIKPDGFDFPHLYGLIDDFCKKNRVSRLSGNRLSSVVEEICQQILIPEAGAPEIRGVIELPGDDMLNVRIQYGGDMFDPFKSENVLSVRIIQGVSEACSYNYDSNSGINTAEIQIANK